MSHHIVPKVDPLIRTPQEYFVCLDSQGDFATTARKFRKEVAAIDYFYCPNVDAFSQGTHLFMGKGEMGEARDCVAVIQALFQVAASYGEDQDGFEFHVVAFEEGMTLLWLAIEPRCQDVVKKIQERFEIDRKSCTLITQKTKKTAIVFTKKNEHIISGLRLKPGAACEPTPLNSTNP